MQRSKMRRMRMAAIPAVVLVLVGCGGRPAETPASSGSAPWFSERAVDVGLDFTHVNGMTGRFVDPEIFAPGVALVDIDNDNDLDVYVVQGQPPDSASAAPERRDRLFRNDLQVATDGRRTLRFVDITEASGIGVWPHGMGVAAGDYDNDGWTDLYLTRLGQNVLLRNVGNGTFIDVSRQSGVNVDAWTVSASFVDIDRDGWLDLYVGSYLAWNRAADVECFRRSGEPDYCAPWAYRPARDRLFRNRRDGTFADVTDRALVGGPTGPALGVSTADLDGDGWMDIYVANDSRENDLWINQRNGTFRNAALEAGVAVNADGATEASMGVDAGDYDNDGDEDLFIANLTAEGSTLYMNRGNGLFDDVAVAAGVRPVSLPYTGFGAAWFDFDNDGWLDLLTVNGAVRTIEALARAGEPFPLHQRKQLLRNRGDGRFEDVTARAGAALQASDVGRGAAFGDVDNDGDVDVIVGNNNGRLQLLLNEWPDGRHWLGLRLTGSQVLGARIQVSRQGAPTLWRRARSDGSYASANDPRVLIGLGDVSTKPTITVTWPDGHRESWPDVDIDRWMTLGRGTGR